jgi:transcriptional regulator of acetoin/glycerol metabolism
LENAVQSAMIVCKTGKLQPEHLPVRMNDFQKEEIKTEGDVTRERILNALEHCKHSKTEAAKLLGISRKTLFNRMKKLRLE